MIVSPKQEIMKIWLNSEHSKDLHIEQLDGISEINQTDEEYECECEERQRKQEEQCKAEGAWCYECSGVGLNRIDLKRHMHKDHNINIYPEINTMLHGSW